MVSERIKVGSDSGRQEAARAAVEEFARECKLGRRETLQMCLLTEETLGMLRGMVEEFDGEMWFSGSGARCEIHLQATAKMDAGQKRDVLSVSSSGRNAAKRGFMARLGGMVSDAMYGLGKSINEYGAETMRYGIVSFDSADGAPEMVPFWALTSYRQELSQEKSGDGEAEAALEELEKSIVAHIADEIVVGVRGKGIEMVIVRDFAGNGKAAGGYSTDKVEVSSRDMANDAPRLCKDYSEHAGLGGKDAARLSLLTEETLGMVRSMSEDFAGRLWIQDGPEGCEVHLDAEAGMDPEKKRRLIAASSSGRNAAPQGLMGKIGEMLANAFTVEADDGLTETLLNDMPEFISFGLSHPMAAPASTYNWSLVTYRETLRNRPEEAARDELEKLEQSIVAHLADDVTVGIRGNRIEMVIRKRFG